MPQPPHDQLAALWKSLLAAPVQVNVAAMFFFEKKKRERKRKSGRELNRKFMVGKSIVEQVHCLPNLALQNYCFIPISEPTDGGKF